jgi:hypothetical protein
MAHRLLSIFFAALLLAACGGDKCADAEDCGAGAGGEGSGGGGGPPEGCEPGVPVFCRCPGGEAGSRVCSADGTEFGACQLASGDPCP